MKILFFEDPLTDSEILFWRNSHIAYDTPVAIGLRAQGTVVRMLLDERQISYAERYGMQSEELIGVHESDWLAVIDDPHLNINSLFQRFHDANDSPWGFYAQRLANDIAELIGAYIKDFDPDVIFTWVPAPYLRKLFPNALLLHREAAAFTRPPWPLTYFLDPCGLQGNSWPALHDLPSLDADVQELRSCFSRCFNREPLAVGNSLLRRFRRVVLVSGQVNGHFSFDAAAPYRSQAHMLLDVLDHAPSDCAVLFVEHPNTPKRLSADEVAWMSGRFDNLILYPRESMGAPSQNMALLCDVTVTSTSSVGWQALFWNRRLISIGNSQYNRVADSRRVEDLGMMMAYEAGNIDRARLSHWLVFHYSISESRLRDGVWLAGYLRGRLNHWNTSGAKGYYDEAYEERYSIEQRFVDTALASSDRAFGQSIASTVEVSYVDMSDDRHFVSGWGSAETHAGLTYRWVVGTRAMLRCGLGQNKCRHLAINLGTHDECGDQRLTVAIGGHELVCRPLDRLAPIELLVNVPDGAIQDNLLEIVFTATEAIPPASDQRALSIIVTRIRILSTLPTDPMTAPAGSRLE